MKSLTVHDNENLLQPLLYSNLYFVSYETVEQEQKRQNFHEMCILLPSNSVLQWDGRYEELKQQVHIFLSLIFLIFERPKPWMKNEKEEDEKQE